MLDPHGARGPVSGAPRIARARAGASRGAAPRGAARRVASCEADRGQMQMNEKKENTT